MRTHSPYSCIVGVRAFPTIRQRHEVATSCKRPFPDVDGSPQTEPLFDTQLLEYSAAGNIGDRKPDQAMLERSRSLPSLQHDYIAPAPGEGPDRFLPPSLTHSMVVSPGITVPWEDWDCSWPISHVTPFHFGPNQRYPHHSRRRSY
jgi:hypothetical protein